MKIYVGRWDLLPLKWEGINGLEKATEEEIKAEVTREIEAWAYIHYNPYNNLMGFYSPKEFEAEFNYDTKNQFTTETYWIKIF